MKIYKYKDLDNVEIEKLCSRGGVLEERVVDIVNEIYEQVIVGGDSALIDLAKKLDKADINFLKVTDEELDKVDTRVSEDLKKAIKQAKENIEKFHKTQIAKKSSDKVETTKGVCCWQEFRAIDKVGLYVPGGTASLISTVLMLVIPAIIAGCKEISICTPPNAEGKISPEILWVAKELGIRNIYKVGGAQAIFALAYGTETVPRVDKIFGPGNAFVTAAKIRASKDVAIDMPAGPSEVLVIANNDSNAEFVAADLLSQAEHGKDSLSILVSTNEDKIAEIAKEVEKQIEKLPRKEIARVSMDNSFAILVDDMDSAIEFSNLYAPEHLILSIKDFEGILPKIDNAGSVFCGEYTTESLGDYASGTNHTLPTSGFAKSYSGLSVSSFGKWVTFQEATKEGLENLGDTIEIIAESEDLTAHKIASAVRRK